jgi:CspA family cold shock protein
MASNKGKVKWFHPKKGYGFVDTAGEREDGKDTFIYWQFIEMEGFKTLKAGQVVEYDLVETDKGPQAHNVKVVAEE